MRNREEILKNREFSGYTNKDSTILIELLLDIRDLLMEKNSANPEDFLDEERPEGAVRYLNGEWLDKDGYPVYEKGTVLPGQRDPRHIQIKEQAKEKAAQAFPDGSNDKMKEFMKTAPKIEIDPKHTEPGMLSEMDPDQWEGRDETYD